MGGLKIAIVGFGAVGTVYSWILERHGQSQVTVVARSNYESVRDYGIQIRSTIFGDIMYKPHKVMPSASEAAKLGPYDFVIVATKALPDVQPLDTLLAPFFAPGAPSVGAYLIIANGIGVEKQLAAAAPDAMILSSVTYVCANIINDIVVHSQSQRLVVGPYRHSVDPQRAHDSIESFAEVFRAGGGAVDNHPNIQTARWKKNIWNCTIACWSTLLSSLVTALLDPAHAELNLSTWRALMTEYVAIAHACGISESDLSLIDVERELSEQVDVCRRRRNGEAPEHWPSMLLDRAQGKALEIEVVIGEVVRAGSAAGIACPRLETLYAA